MEVRLPREVSGKELIEAVKAVASEIENCYLTSREVPRYDPGSSVKKVLGECQLTVWQTKLVERGFFRKRTVRERTPCYFVLPAIKTDQSYKSLDIEVKWELVTSSFNIEASPRHFSHIENLLEEFWSKVFERLSNPN